MRHLELSRNAKWTLELGNHAPSNFLRPIFRAAEVALRRKPGKGWEALESLDLPETAREHFEHARAESGRFALPASIVTPGTQFPLKLRFCTPSESLLLTIEDTEALQLFASMLSATGERASRDDRAEEFARQLLANRVLSERGAPQLRCDEPGIYRLQHASLLFRTASTKVLVDPVSSSAGDYWLDSRDLPAPDAILISHSHLDHFCLATLLHFPRDTAIVVPEVHTSSMLCCDMATLLRAAGFTNVIAASWFTRHQFGDITVSVYPFYGEQPWLSFGAPWSAFRNMGNTYVVGIDGHNAWVLIDSGHEFGASMTDMCENIRNDLGDIDIVLSNVREFHWHPGQIDGSGRYLFCFPMDYLERPDTWPDNQLMTLGPSGIRRLLAKIDARYFLPYAHWWHSRLENIPLVDDNSPEPEMVAAIGRSDRDSASSTPTTTLCNWNVGNVARWDRRGRLAIQSGLRDN